MVASDDQEIRQTSLGHTILFSFSFSFRLKPDIRFEKKREKAKNWQKQKLWTFDGEWKYFSDSDGTIRSFGDETKIRIVLYHSHGSTYE